MSSIESPTEPATGVEPRAELSWPGRVLLHGAFLLLIGGLMAFTHPQAVPAWLTTTGRSLLPPSERGHLPVGSSARSVLSPSSRDIAAPRMEEAAPSTEAAPSDMLPVLTGGNLLKTPQLQTIVPKRPRKELITYTVQKGDNLSTIAEMFDVDVDTIIWANGALEEDPDYIVVGDKLLIPPVPGVLHKVQTGDTLQAIAEKYKGNLRAMLELEFNRLSDAGAVPVSGTLIMVPGGEKAYQPRLVYIGGRAVMVNAPRGVGRFVWPTQGWITQYWSPDHRAIDIGAPEGTPIYAADAGVVIAAGWNGDYGIALIIDHGNGFQTLYAHLLVYYPSVGQNVRRGQAIGKMGSTGKSTGPHLHFEVRYQGGNVNPLRYLPQ